MLIELVAIFCPFLPGLLILFTFFIVFSFDEMTDLNFFYGKIFCSTRYKHCFFLFSGKSNFFMQNFLAELKNR